MSDEIFKQLEPWRRAHLRPAWRPVVGDAPSAPTGSRFGGLAWLPNGTRAPECGNCHRPLRLLVQLDARTMPPQAAAEFGPALLQVFYCEQPDCEVQDEGWAPFSKIHHARLIDPLGPGAPAAPSGEPFEEKAISGWEALEDFPSPPEHEEQGLKLKMDLEAKTVQVLCPSVGLASPSLPMDQVDESKFATAEQGDKLLGWPSWVQGVEYPACPRCEARMRYLFQLDSENNLPVMWGDGGTAHVTQCPTHRDVLTMGWACY